MLRMSVNLQTTSTNTFLKYVSCGQQITRFIKIFGRFANLTIWSEPQIPGKSLVVNPCGGDVMMMSTLKPLVINDVR